MSFPTISEFHGKHRFLSNFWLCPIPLDGTVYQSVEHAYQSRKTLSPKERDRVNYIRKTTTFGGVVHHHVRETSAGEAKRAGRTVTLRGDWEQVKLRVMEEVLRVKFADPDLRARLIATGDAVLEEGNLWHDTFYGVCMCKGCGRTGRNELGKLLMRLRDELRKSESESGTGTGDVI